jgi:hypothetical protein
MREVKAKKEDEARGGNGSAGSTKLGGERKQR